MEGLRLPPTLWERLWPFGIPRHGEENLRIFQESSRLAVVYSDQPQEGTMIANRPARRRPGPRRLGLSYPAALACGDKFLMVGRGAKFQRAYASVHPGKILIYARPSTDPKAAIRDPQLHKALRQAGHAVSVIEDWALLEAALKTAPTDVVLVDVAEAARLQAAIAASPTPSRGAVRRLPGGGAAGRRHLPAQVVRQADPVPGRSRERHEGAQQAREAS